MDLDLSWMLFCEPVYPDDNAPILIYRPLLLVGTLLDPSMDEPRLDSLPRSSKSSHILHQPGRAILDGSRQLFEVEASSQGIDCPSDAGLVGDYLLGPERDPNRLLGGKTQGFVARVRVERLGPSENRRQGLDRNPSHVIVRLLSSQCLATGLCVKP